MVEKVVSYTDMLNKSRELDQKVELKQDIYVAKFTKSVELKAAIYADETLSDSEKRLSLQPCFSSGSST